MGCYELEKLDIFKNKLFLIISLRNLDYHLFPTLQLLQNIFFLSGLFMSRVLNSGNKVLSSFPMKQEQYFHIQVLRNTLTKSWFIQATNSANI